MCDLVIISLLLVTHFIGDFILQTDEQAKGKSSSNLTLFQHICTYIIPFAVLGFIVPISFAFLLVNAVLHFCTDWCTSRITKKLWAEGKVHNFFVTIGADQLIHALTLIWTYEWLSWYMF